MDNINAFVVTKNEKYIYAGTLLGEIWTIEVATWKVIDKIKVTYGAINVVAMSPSHPWLGVYGEDNWLCLLKFDDITGALSLKHTIRTRDIKPKDDPYLPVRSTSQALAFHHNILRLAGHGGTAGMFEIEFDADQFDILYCKRVSKDYDFVTLSYVKQTDKVLCGAGNGKTILTDNGNVIKSWLPEDINNQKTIHWFEPIKENQYLCASDSGRIFRLNLNGKLDIGPWFARDHMEHVTYDAANNKVYASSFDRTVYEVDLDSLDVVRVAWQAPFKLRWLKALKTKPYHLVVQCRNGGLYLVDTQPENGKIIDYIKNTPDALWSASYHQDKVIIAGEGDYYYEYEPQSSDLFQHQIKFNELKIFFKYKTRGYTKRVASHEREQLLAFGRTDGSVILKSATEERLINFQEPIRDICFDTQNSYLYVATEAGSVYQYHCIDNRKIKIYHSAAPIWAIALHPDKPLLAIAHRFSEVIFYDLTAEKVSDAYYANITELPGQPAKFIKRIRFADANTLFIGHGGGISKYDLEAQKTSFYCGSLLPNTVEDFYWDKHFRYFVAINYSRDIYLFDYITGELIFEQGDHSDYSKGILFLKDSMIDDSVQTDFIVYGRYAKPRYFRLNNDRIICLGDI